MKKRILSVILAAALATTVLAACGGSDSGSSSAAANSAASSAASEATEAASSAASEATSEASGEAVVPDTSGVKTYGEDETLQIAYIGWGFADQTSLFYLRNYDMLSEAFNVEYTLSDAWGTSTSAEDVVEVLPSFIESGAQATIIHSMSSRIVEICEEGQCYFTLSGEVILDQDLLAMCEASPYYVGTVALADYDGGYECARYLIEDLGCKNIAYLRTSTRNLEENRLNGAKAAINELGANLVGEYTGDQTAESLRDFIANNPDMDGVIIGNGTAGQAELAAQTLEAVNVTDKVQMATICSPVDLEGYLDSGTIDYIMAGEGIEPTICTMLLINAMRGHRVDDAAIEAFTHYFPITTSEQVTDYATYFAAEGDELPLEADVLEQDWLKVNNPDLNNEYILNWLAENYNIESFNEAHGK